MKRRTFLRNSGLAVLGVLARGGYGQVLPSGDAEILELIDEHRPSRLSKPLADAPEEIGASHVAGKYHLTSEPFLLEGARKLLALGSRVGKFWFTPETIASSYPFETDWGTYRSFVELAVSPAFRQLFVLPFSTVILEAHTPRENGWQNPDRPAAFYDGVSQEFYDLAAHFYRTYGDRKLTIILQHWEGDWLLRGRGGELWTSPPRDWRERCGRMTRWLAARQGGVLKARAEFGKSARCRVLHAAEVNRVADFWNGIPTMTEHVLPNVELDLVSYSCYDGMRDALTLWKCVAEIQKRACTTGVFGGRSVYIGEIGIPENEQPQRLSERWDKWFGVLRAAKVGYILLWELYCNEFSPLAPKPPPTPVSDPRHLRGFWLVKPDGALSETGRFFQSLLK